MRIVFKIGFLALAITISGKLAAQETTQTNNDLLHYYDTELFQWSYGMFGGLALNFQNQSSATTFGIKEPMKNALMQYEDANQQYRLYHDKTIAGNILLWGGLATTLAGAYMPIFYYTPTSNSLQDTNAYENTLKVSLGMILGGFVSEVIGMFVLQSGQESIFNAVNLYNRHRINDYRQK